VAAVLNACKGIGYPLSVQQIVNQVNAALASCDRGTILTLASTLDRFNNLGCAGPNGQDLPCHVGGKPPGGKPLVRKLSP
jgi:hypothetical protein